MPLLSVFEVYVLNYYHSYSIFSLSYQYSIFFYGGCENGDDTPSRHDIDPNGLRWETIVTEAMDNGFRIGFTNPSETA